MSVKGDSTDNCTHAQICTGYAQLQCHLVVFVKRTDHEVDREILVLLHLSKAEGAAISRATAFDSEWLPLELSGLQRQESTVSLPRAATSTP